MNVGQDTTLRDGDGTEKAVEFFIVADSQLQMARNDTGFLCNIAHIRTWSIAQEVFRLTVIASSVSSQFQDFSS